MVPSSCGDPSSTRGLSPLAHIIDWIVGGSFSSYWMLLGPSLSFAQPGWRRCLVDSWYQCHASPSVSKCPFNKLLILRQHSQVCAKTIDICASVKSQNYDKASWGGSIMAASHSEFD